MPTFYRCSVNDIETGDVTFIDFNTQYVRDFVFSDIPYNIASSESDYNSFLADTELLTNIDEIASDNNKFYASGYIANISYDYLNSKNVPILILQRASNYEDYYVHYYDGEKTYSYFQHDSWNSFVLFKTPSGIVVPGIIQYRHSKLVIPTFQELQEWKSHITASSFLNQKISGLYDVIRRDPDEVIGYAPIYESPVMPSDGTISTTFNLRGYSDTNFSKYITYTIGNLAIRHETFGFVSTEVIYGTYEDGVFTKISSGVKSNVGYVYYEYLMTSLPIGGLYPSKVYDQQFTQETNFKRLSIIKGFYENDSNFPSVDPDYITLLVPENIENNTVESESSYKLSCIGHYGLNEYDISDYVVWRLGYDYIYNNRLYSEYKGWSISSNGTLALSSSNDIRLGKMEVIVFYPEIENYEKRITRDFYLKNFSIYSPGGISGSTGTSGGTGNFGKNEVSDSVLPPSGSVAGNASTSGMFTRYLVDSSYLDIIGDWLWADDLGLVIAKSTISLIYGDPSESLISLMSYPFDINTLPGVTTRSQNLYWGGHNTGIGMIALTGQSATVDWGTINLEEYWGNFLDYEPHTRIELYLPWGTGFVSIDPNMCLPGSIQVVTNIDLNKGSCVHNVIGKTTKFESESVVIGTYAGQCSQQIPLVSSDYASKVAGVVVAATSLAVAATSAAGAVSAGVQSNLDYGRTHSLPYGDVKGTLEYKKGLELAESTAQAPYRSTQKTAARLAAGSSVAAMKRSGIISRNGSFTDGSAALGVQHPYVILSRPSQSVPKEYGNHYGYPSNIYANLRTLKGYTEIGEIHLDNILATDEEISELDSILKGGVIF